MTSQHRSERWGLLQYTPLLCTVSTVFGADLSRTSSSLGSSTVMSQWLVHPCSQLTLSKLEQRLATLHLRICSILSCIRRSPMTRSTTSLTVSWFTRTILLLLTVLPLFLLTVPISGFLRHRRISTSTTLYSQIRMDGRSPCLSPDLPCRVFTLWFSPF
ncbi:hypothetical protein [Pig stool associated circular ssDNA virus]|nr:hypothetical protein [Pig stool associated circular ssDNA virus]